MNTHDEAYTRLARVLDTLPNGFPPSADGVEFDLLRKIFTPREAELFCDMRLTFETAEQVAERTGRPLAGLEDELIRMGKNGQLFALQFGDSWYFKMLPWVFGIYEFQLNRIDREMAELSERYHPVYARRFFSDKPQLMQVLPVEETIHAAHAALPYAMLSALIEKSQAFLVNECICKKERGLLGKPCDRPLEVCLALAPVPGVFDRSPTGRVITRDEAYRLLKQTEAAGLVHLTNNLQNGQLFICNCCKCCCGALRAINELGIAAWDVVNSQYYARIDAEACIACGLCAQGRCQVGAVMGGNDTYQVVPERCIGCGLCIGTCPVGAISLVHKEPGMRAEPPVTENEWFEERGWLRGVDFTRYR
ncbi:MAG TPA: 4Fe-4S binding protein [Deltaproteobacteria bacterium]|nr:4Fe-4S binding protein [Deltaproteobacteria bacterium]